MIVRLRQLPLEFSNDYFKSFLLLALVPLFPEYISFILVIGALIFAVKDIKASGRKIQMGTLGWILGTYCLYLSITCFYSTHPFQSALAAILWWFTLLAFIIVVNLATDKDRLDSFLFCVSTAAGLVGFIALVQYVLNVLFDIPICSTWDWLDQFVFAYVPFDLTLVPFPTRAYSTFPNPNMLAQYLGMTAPFVVACNFIEKRPKLRFYNLICLIMTAVGILVSYSRGGYLALIAIVLIFIIINIRKHFIAIALSLTAAFFLIPDSIFARLTDMDSNGRFRIWNVAIEKILERPIFGYGVGTQPSAAIFHSVKLDAPHAHSIILQVVMEGGCIALLILLAAAIYCFKNGVGLMLKKKTAAFWGGFAACGFILATSLHGLVDYPLTTPKLLCGFMCLMALAERFIVLYREKREPSQPEPEETL